MIDLNKKILDNAPVSIITIDKKGYVTSANKYYRNFSRTKEFIGHNIFASKFFIRENLIEDYKKLLAKGTIVRRENCYERNNLGQDKYLKVIAVPLRDERGKIEGALSMAIDNTEAFLFRNKLEKLNKNLEKIVGQRTAQLRDALDFKKTFMADLSHEWRTSLSIIRGNLELMPKNSIEYGEVFNEIKKMSAMLADLSFLVNFDLICQKLDYEKINLNQLISSVVDALKVAAKKKNVKIKHENKDILIKVSADRSKLERLILNLVKNAINYNKKGGWVRVWTEKAGNGINLKAQDNGIGIDREHLPHIFERFYRVDKTKSRDEGGSGLGLAICKEIAEAHGGKINVQSKLGQGTLFTVYLPNIDKNSK